MQLCIDRDALELVLRTLFTCRCPITEDQEKKIFNILITAKQGELIDYDQILNIVGPYEDTVFRRVADFSIWQASVGVDPYTINREHVIRHFSSTYHWNHVVAKGLPEAYKKVCHIPTWFLAHMLLAVKITHVAKSVIAASYESDSGIVRLLNIFVPKDHDPKLNEVWAVHFAGLLTHLSSKEHKVVSLMTESNHFLHEFCRKGIEIDYSNFERYGNHSSFCRERYEHRYSEEPMANETK